MVSLDDLILGIIVIYVVCHVAQNYTLHRA